MKSESRPTQVTPNYIREAVVTWTVIAFPIFTTCALIGFLSAIFTMLELYDAKIYLLLVGLPSICGAWSAILIRNLIKPVPTSWLAMPMVAAVLLGSLTLVMGHDYTG